ncbi:hypothetical protein DH2020_033997 [Rehmannia glutinosa]|uniref:DSP-PTPase phosphatase fused to NAD+ Kinase domain-containing protein n=1 Tax=Rehmannia glutinosa TaxID=99300 RepID=A0ABR0VAM0_REHGL
MNRAVATPSFCRQLSCVSISGPGFGLVLQKWKKKKRWSELGRRSFRLLVRAQLSSSLSVNIGLDSQSISNHDSSHLPWVGPLPGDIAEVEAYCRIFRAAERFHNSLMDALCNPLTVNGREDVLVGRSSIMNSFRDLDKNVMDDSIPPLANFRSEMKSYCESLHVALENYLIPGDDRSLNVWRKLQRLKNVCYDSGFPRGDDHPCQTLFANWSPVYLSTSKEESQSEHLEVAFWKGSQVTEESLKWLLEKGFRTIIDLRAETVKDNFYETILVEAISSGKIELIKLPVEVGTAPSVEQVEEIHGSHHFDPVRVNNADLRTQGTREVEDSDFSVNTEEGKSSYDGNGSLPQNSDKSYSNLDLSTKEADNTLATTEDITVNSGTESTIDFYQDVKPLESQLPPPDVFSRKEMSSFFRNKKISPGTYFSYEKKRLDMLSALRYKSNGTVLKKEANSNLSLHKEDIVNGSLGSIKSSSKPQSTAISNGSYQDPTVLVNPMTHLDKANSGAGYDRSKENGSINTGNDLAKNVTSMTVTGSNRADIESYLSSDDENLEILEGNMCASATGVVRVQSRKKAEMFLVRTDGFSCSREKVTESSLAFTHPSTQQQMLLWKSTPKTVLLLKKLGQELMEEAKEVATFLYYQEKMNILVEPEVHDVFARIPGFGFVQTFYSQDTSDLHERVDLVACLGGDGVILHASNLFRGAVPPVVSFNLGSLGFLTSHTFDDYKNDLRQVIHGNNTIDGVYITLRMRLRCQIFRNGKAMPGKIFDVLNEVVVDRGSNPYLSRSNVQGDGVIVATPTGSTAYSTAAGGSMVHPNVPCMLFTPICPHSLSFRPVILPDSARLELKIPEDARSNCWVSFDGKRRQQLSRGDSVRISMSQHPLPTVNKSDQTGDWFQA